MASILGLFSNPGLYLNGELTGNFYALLFAAAALTVAITMFRFRRSKSGIRTVGAVAASAILVTLIVTVIVIALLALLVWGIFSHGVCSPHC